jgi:hypothetical protein
VKVEGTIEEEEEEEIVTLSSRSSPKGLGARTREEEEEEIVTLSSRDDMPWQNSPHWKWTLKCKCFPLSRSRRAPQARLVR